MKTNEIYNLFGEPLSDEIERNVKKNKTLTFKKKSDATKEYHYIPIKNIKHRKETKQFLNEMLGLLTEGWEIDKILYAIGLDLTAGKQLPDFHLKSKSNLVISVPEKVREEHDLLADCYQYLTSKHDLKKESCWTIRQQEQNLLSQESTSFRMEKYIKYEEQRQQLAINVKETYFRTPEKLIYHTVSRYLDAIDRDARLTTCTANFFLVKDIKVSTKCIMAIFNSKIYNRLNKLLFGDKVNRGCNIKKLPIPILTAEQQMMMESYVDEMKYDEIEKMLTEIFQL